jgi:KaiC/GvpD/RAD55 family RecA-like ATPase
MALAQSQELQTEILPDHIPEQMRRLTQWVCWRAEWSPSKSKFTKVPISPTTGNFASTNRPATWGTFDQALDFLSRHPAGSPAPAHGIGFVFTANDPFVGVDLDHCLTPDGQLTPEARAVVDQLDTYTEWSPSGRGLHCICTGSLPGPGHHSPTIEIYDRGRYFTVSGRLFEGRQHISQPETLESLYLEAGGRRSTTPSAETPPPPTPVDPEALPRFPTETLAALVLEGHGMEAHGNDHSRALFVASTALLASRSWSPADVLTIITTPGVYLADNGALKRRATVASAREWAWRYVVCPAIAATSVTFEPIVEEPAQTLERLKPTHDLVLTRASDLAGSPIPARDWLLRNYIPKREVTALYGAGGLGKSFFALQLATAAATGTPFLGFDVPPGNVLAVFCEDDTDEIRRRLQSIGNEKTAFSETDFESTLDNLYYQCRRTEASELVVFDAQNLAHPTVFYNSLLQAAKQLKPELIILDSLYNFLTADENQKPVARQFIRLLSRLADECGAAVLLLAHPSKSGEATGRGDSGSVAWSAAVRSRLFLSEPADPEEREKHPRRRLLSRKKSNYSTDPGPGELLLDSTGGPFIVVSTGAEREQTYTDEIDTLVCVARQALESGSPTRIANNTPGNILSVTEGQSKTRWTDNTRKRYRDALNVAIYGPVKRLRLETRRDAQRKLREFIIPVDSVIPSVFEFPEDDDWLT